MVHISIYIIIKDKGILKWKLFFLVDTPGIEGINKIDPD